MSSSPYGSATAAAPAGASRNGWTALPGAAILVSALGTLPLPSVAKSSSSPINGGKDTNSSSSSSAAGRSAEEKRSLTQLHALLRQLSSMSIAAPEALDLEECLAARKDDPPALGSTATSGAGGGAWAPVLKARLNNRIRVRWDRRGNGETPGESCRDW